MDSHPFFGKVIGNGTGGRIGWCKRLGSRDGGRVPQAAHGPLAALFVRRYDPAGPPH